jgi:hypothetical protein
LAVASQALDFIGGAKRDRTVDLYNAIVVDARLLYIQGRDVSRRMSIGGAFVALSGITRDDVKRLLIY